MIRSNSPAGEASVAADRLAVQLAGEDHSQPSFTLLLDPDGRAGAGGLARAWDSLPGGARSWAAVGWADAEVHRPYGPFPRILETLANRLSEAAPEIVLRYGQTIRSLAPAAAGELLHRTPPFEAQLVGCALRGSRHGLRDYFVGRNVQPRILDDLVRFLLDTAAQAQHEGSGPLRIFLDRLEQGDRATLQCLSYLPRYAAGRPLALLGVWNEAVGRNPDAVADLRRAGWTVVQLPGADAPPATADVVSTLPADERAALRIAAVLTGWFEAGALARACGLEPGAAAAVLETLRARGLVVGAPELGYTVPSGTAAAVLAGLSAGELVDLHRGAAVSAASVFERIHHRRMSGDKGLGEDALQALEAAWSVSAYDDAFWFAEAAFADPAIRARHSRSFLLGLLCYEARRFPETHEHLLAALEDETDPEQRAILLRLIGYNGVFGLKRHDVALDFLDRAREFFEGQGNTRDVAWIRNTMAFGMMQTGRAADAIAIEKATLESTRQLAYPDRFLLSILQLNLGRLHRGRSLEESLAYIRSALADSRGDSGPYMLLLLYITLGNLYLGEGRAREAAAYFARCVDMAFDIDLAGFSDRTFPLLSRVFADHVGPVAEGVALRGDVARLLCHYNLALSYRNAGLHGQAERYRRWVRREIVRWGVPAYEAALDPGPVDDPGNTPVLRDSRTDAGVESFLARYSGYLAHRRVEGGGEVGRLLAEGSTVAMLSGFHEGEPSVVRSFVLFDPRSADLRRRVDAELGRQEQAGGVLALREAADLFEDAHPDYTSLVQEVTLRPAHRARFGAVFPVRTRLRFVDDDWGELADAVGEFAARTSVPFVAAVGFRRVGEEIADSPALAAKYFLETGLDRLFLDGHLVEKRLGTDAVVNLFPLRPHFSGYAAMPTNRASGEPATVVARERFFRVGDQGTAVLSRCDGRTTVGELVESLPEAEPPQVCRFLLQMRRHGVIHFTHA